MPSYLSVTGNCLFLFEPFEERGVQMSVYEGYFRVNQTAGTANCTIAQSQQEAGIEKK